MKQYKVMWIDGTYKDGEVIVKLEDTDIPLDSIVDGSKVRDWGTYGISIKVLRLIK